MAKRIKIFISYSSNDKHLAGKLKRAFESYENIDCFIAHDDIPPGSQWEAEILEYLEKCDYFIPLQTADLNKSFWCQQEIGIAVARGIQIIPLLPDVGFVDPVGFCAKWQGIKIRTEEIKKSVNRLLIEKHIIEPDPERDEIEKRLLILEKSQSWAQAGENIRLLMEFEAKLTKSDILKVLEIVETNSQVSGSFEAQPYFQRLFRKNAGIIDKEKLEQFL